MKLIYHGHACFELITAEGSAVFDPYKPGYLPGLTLPPLTADICISSHGHGDHCCPEAVAPTGNEPYFTLTQIPCFHDEVRGRKRGDNLISIVDAEGLRVCHMGDIGHRLGAEQLELLHDIDILMLPVGGVYTVDAKGAKQLILDIRPRVIVPMHYRDGGRGLANVAPVSDFLALFPEDMTVFLGKNEFDCAEPDKQTVVVFDV